VGGDVDGKRVGPPQEGPLLPTRGDLYEIDEADLQQLDLDGLKSLAQQLVIEVDVSAMEDREKLLELLRSSSR
jgi:hypothetical protein